MTPFFTANSTVSRPRAFGRDVLVWLGVALTAPLWIPARIERRYARRDGWFAGCSELLSLAPGKPGIFLRRSFYRMTLAVCATDCHIGFGTTLAHPDAEIHPGVYLGSRCTVGSVVFERDVTVGSNVDLLSGRRQHGMARVDVSVQHQSGRFERIRIGANSWIGNSSVIMADVGEKSVIGAGAVVVRPIAAVTVAVGNPAKVIRERAA
jgi:acetyltransferase-like isoleucine patch superfamily enzyme